MGQANARRFILTGERFDARRAEAMGLLSETVPEAALDEAVGRVLEEFLKGGPAAVAAAKQLIFEVDGCDRNRQRAMDEHTASVIARLRVSAEGQEGLEAFLQKRPPAW